MFENLLSESGLSLDRLHALLQVHDAGSIAAAAPGDSIRQSQFSRQLRELSEFFGCEVARRQGKVLKLTPEGLRLVELIRQQFRALQDFKAECRAEALDTTIAAGDSLIQWLVIPRLGALPQADRDHRFSTVNLRTREIVQRMVDGRVDFAVVRRDALEEGMFGHSLGHLAYCAVVPRALVPATKRASLKAVFTELPMAAQSTDGQFSSRLREITSSFGGKFHPALACQSFPQVISAVRSGHYVAVVPEIALVDLDLDSCHVLRAETFAGLRRELVLAYSPRLLLVRPRMHGLAKALHAAFRL